jgi:hypothetical protein
MKERPILFSRAMVRAILDGRKTQTRRVVKWLDLKPGINLRFTGLTASQVGGAWVLESPTRSSHKWRCAQTPCPYGMLGDRLWVREAWRVGKPHDSTAPRDILPPLIERGKGVTVLYEAGGWRSIGPEGRDEPVYRDNERMPDWAGKLRPSMFMPRALSRITLEITDVRVERLQGINEDDARAEGAYLFSGEDGGWKFDRGEQEYDSAIEAYRYLWDGLNAARGQEWEVNPWVWVVEFRRII